MATRNGTHGESGEAEDARLTSTVVAGVRRGDESSLKCAFEVLYVRLLRVARASPIPIHAASELVTSFLDDFLIDLPPVDFGCRPLVPYAVTSFRNYLKQIVRADAVRLKHGANAARIVEDGCERIVAECHSEYSLREANTADAGSSQPLSPFVAHLVANLTQEEEGLLRLLGRGLSVKDAGRELGVDYGVLRVRLHRLRVRLRMAAMNYAETATGLEQRNLSRFFRRLENPIRSPQRAANG